MEQRTLRLGDIVDDYCPRERRITNHAIVALVGEAVRQTRCATCESEHLYKGGKIPKRRKKDDPETLFEQVLADVSGGALVAPKAEAKPVVEDVPARVAASANGASGAEDAESSPDGDEAPPASEADRPDEFGSGHRRLIRASLPKSDTELPPARPIPEFTMHQKPHGQFRGHGQGGNGQNRNGFRQGRPGNDSGQGPGSGLGQGGRPHRGGRGRRSGSKRPR